MNQSVEKLLTALSSYLVLGMVLTLPFLLAPWTTDFFETPKFLALTVLTLTLLILWAARAISTNKLSLVRTPLDLPLLLLLVVAVVSTFFSPSWQVSVMGSLPKVHGSLTSTVLYVLLYFVLVASLKQIGKTKAVTSLLLLSGAALAALTFLSYWGINLLPFPFARSLTFTPTGSSFATASYLIILLPFVVLKVLHLGNSPKDLPVKAAWTGVLTLFLATITLIGSLPTYLAAAAALILILISTSVAEVKKSLLYLAAPLAVAVVVGILPYLPTLLPQLPLPPLLATHTQKFPRELQLPLTTSWKVSVSAFRDSPFWGTGPASYLFDFTLYKPLDFNNTKLWNIRFDSAFNEYLQVLATLGATGLLALGLLTVVGVSLGLKALVADSDSQAKALALSSILFFLTLAFHASTLVVWVLGLLVLALFLVETKRAHDLHLNLSTPQLSQALDAVPGVVMMAVVLLTLFSLFFTGKFALADYHHRRALDAISQNQGIPAREALLNAVRLNPYADRYRLDLAQTSFALANAIALAKTTGAASPSGGLTDQDKQNIQVLLMESVDHGRQATALSPNNATNWEVLGALYRQIAGVAQNALQFSLDSYGRAIQRDPLNPMLRLNVGGIYFAAKNYDLAVRFFTDSVNLKPDFANGYYNLAVALKDKGDLSTAILAAEKVASLVDKSSADYTVADNLLKEIKDKTATPAAEPPAAQTESALGDTKKKLPKVLDLPKPEKITTPSAVKKSQDSD